MTRLLWFFVVGLISLQARAGIESSSIDYAHLIHCDYTYWNMPSATIDIGFWSDNSPQTSLQLALGMGANPEKKTVTPVKLAAGEAAHVIISKEVPNGSLEMIVYNPPTSKGDTRLINGLFKQEFWGTCHAKN